MTLYAKRESEMDDIVIIGAARTPIGAFQGALSKLTAAELGAAAVRAAVERAGSPAVDEVVMGCVLPAGAGQAPARQAALLAGLPFSTTCLTVNKVCGSGMMAVILGCDALSAGRVDALVAGGMESMSNAPYLLPKARSGQRLGHGQVVDHMFFDGLEDRYSIETNGRLMGTFAEECASHFSFSRSDQDAFSAQSALLAQDAMSNGSFEWETVPLQVSATQAVATDEIPPKVDSAKARTLKPAFASNGTVTAANSSSIADGAAALVLCRAAHCTAQGYTPIARIAGHATHAHEPRWFTTAPASAVNKLLARIGWAVHDVDLWEINEAFAVVTMAAIQALGLDRAKVNVNGGACAIGHPIGASGARILVTLIGALKSRGLNRGVATLCIGGGEATAIAVEMI